MVSPAWYSVMSTVSVIVTTPLVLMEHWMLGLCSPDGWVVPAVSHPSAGVAVRPFLSKLVKV